MIPSRFVALDALPMTPNGKVDRAALPSAARTVRQSALPRAGPRTPIEEGVYAIWTEILGIELIGIDDDFLDLGGDSLAAVRIASRVLKAFQVDLSPQELFDAPTIAEMADLIAQRQRL